MRLLIAGAGGFVGSVLRYLISGWASLQISVESLLDRRSPLYWQFVAPRRPGWNAT